MKLTRSSVILINIVIILSGVVLVLLGVRGSQVNPLLEAIGTSLIATGGVNLLDRLLTEKPTLEGVRIVANVRGTLDPSIHNRKNHAEKVDLVGVSLSDCLAEIVNDPKQVLINRVLFNNVRLRLMLVHPDAPFVAQRAVEDNMSHESELRQRQLQSVEYCVMFFKRLQDSYEDKGIDKPLGSVQVKLIEFCPHITIERYDTDIYWGLYTSDTAGIKAPMFLTNRDENYLLYDKLKNHFTSLLGKDLPSGGSSPKNNFLITMQLGAPQLNRALAEDILTKERVRMLLEEGPGSRDPLTRGV